MIVRDKSVLKELVERVLMETQYGSFWDMVSFCVRGWSKGDLSVFFCSNQDEKEILGCLLAPPLFLINEVFWFDHVACLSG
jgi:hypothetical protein